MMTTVREILARKPDVYAVRPDDTVYQALQLMAEKNIGAVLVMTGDEITGVFSERDYARRVVLHGHTSRDTAVGSLMTADVVSIGDVVRAVVEEQQFTIRSLEHYVTS